MRFARLLFALFVFFWLVPPPAGAEEEVARFLIEKISVEGASRAAAGRIVVSSSLLEEGKAYTEEELRQAMHRIRRLPFVLDADFALEKGSERGRFELSIAIEEPKPVFVSLNGGFDLSPSGPGREDLDFEDRWFDYGEIGARQFVGENGLAFASIDSFDDRVTLGYTRYGLFGRGASANLLLDIDWEGEAPWMSLQLNVPVVGNHLVLTSSSYGHAPDRHEWSQNLAWRYDSTDDPIFPQSGLLAEIGATYREQELESRRPDEVPPDILFFSDVRTRLLGGQLWARKHLPLTSRQSLSLGGSAGLTRGTSRNSAPTGESYRSEGETWSGSADLGHLIRLDRWQHSSLWRELWLETQVTYFSTEFENVANDFRFENAAASLRLSFRNAWGIARFSLSYVENLRGGR